jgi:hypothetical protein
MAELDGMAIARERIAIEAEIRTGDLDLSGLGLTDLPDELWSLTDLRSLDLGSGARRSFSRHGSEAPNIGPNFIGAALGGLSDLTELRTLDLSETDCADLWPIMWLNKIDWLSVRGTKVDYLTPIEGLTNLIHLELTDSPIADLTPISALLRLKSLFVGGTKVSDLTPISDLTNLTMLAVSGTRVTDLAPIAGLANLQLLFLARTMVRDLAPIAKLNGLTMLDARCTRVETLPHELGALRGLEGGAGTPFGGLELEGSPLADPLPRLIAPGQPEATRNVLAWLRGELDAGSLPDPVASELGPASAPPDVPPPGAGLHVAIRAQDGVIDFAPPEALDREGNNRRLLEALHPELRRALADFRAALARGNNPPSVLARAADDYAEIADCALPDVNFAVLYARGVRLRSAITESREAVERGAEPAVSIETGTAIRTLLDLHGAFIGATKDGIDLSAAEEVDETTPEGRRALRAATVAFAQALQAQNGTIVTAQVAGELLAAAQAAASGPNPARSTVVAGAQAREVAGGILAMAGAGGLAVGLAAAAPVVAAPGVGVLVALLAVEPIKASKGFVRIRDFLAGPINGSGDPAPRLAALQRHLAFAKQELARFDALAALGDGFGWMREWGVWIRREIDRPRPPEPSDD